MALKMRELPTIRVLRVYSPDDADDVEVSGRLRADWGTDLTKGALFQGGFQDEKLYIKALSLHRAGRKVEAVLDPENNTVISIVGCNFPPAEGNLQN